MRTQRKPLKPSKKQTAALINGGAQKAADSSDAADRRSADSDTAGEMLEKETVEDKDEVSGDEEDGATLIPAPITAAAAKRARPFGRAVRRKVTNSSLKTLRLLKLHKAPGRRYEQR